jgi:hypothetical protein
VLSAGQTHVFPLCQCSHSYDSGIPSDVEALDDDLCVDGERLEDNEKLRLHVLGMQSFWTQHLALYSNMSKKLLPPLQRHQWLCYAVLWALNQLIKSESCCLLIPTRHIETSNATSFSSLPSRYLPPGSIKLLWHQMLQDKGHPNVSQLGISRFPWQRFAQICRDWFTVEKHGALADSVPCAIWHSVQSLKHKWTCKLTYFWCVAIVHSCAWPFLVDIASYLKLRYGHFWKSYRAKWSNVLRFQTATSHGCCDECQDFKEQFRCSKGVRWLKKAEFSRKLLPALLRWFHLFSSIMFHQLLIHFTTPKKVIEAKSFQSTWN